MPNRAPVVSVIIPVLNETENVQETVQRVLAVLRAEGELVSNTEILFIDDGSTDTTWREVSAAAEHDKEVRGIRFSRNFGHQNALYAGFEAAQGDVLITMDGDLQHPPETIADLLEKWRDGFKLVTTERIDDLTIPWPKRWTSSAFYRVFSALADVDLRKGTSDFRLVDRSVLDSVMEFNDVRIFFRGAFVWTGVASTVVSYECGPRRAGRTKYNWLGMTKFATDAVVAFSTVPLRIGIGLGFLTSFAAFVELVYVLVLVARGVTVPGWASTVGVVSFLFGILFVLLGIVGLYLARIHESLQGRPRYIVASTTESA